MFCYILHRTSTNPPHFNATKQTQKQTHTEPEYPPKPRNLEEITPPTQLEIETIPPPAAKRPKTSPFPQSPVLTGLCAATRTSEETPGRERRNQAQSGGDKKKGSIIGNHIGGCKNGSGKEGTSTSVNHKSNARDQEPKEIPPRTKRPTATDWNEMNRNQRHNWRQRHKL